MSQIAETKNDQAPRERLIGRERELRALTGLLDGIQDCGAAVVLRGEAGIGKSLLVETAADEARVRGLQVLTTTGVESEAHLPFAGLHQLLLPVLADADHLPPPQKRAVDVAFGVVDDAPPELFLIALATLHLLSDTAARTPKLLVVEDGQWLDRPTAEVLTFVARRLESDPIVMLVALRDGYDTLLDAGGLPELVLDRLDDPTSARLLDARNPELEQDLKAQILDEAEGNPLALIELPALLRSKTRRDAVSRLPVSTRLERAFSARAHDLPDATCKALLVVAADDRGLLREVLAATAVLTGDGLDDAVLVPAIEAALVELDLPHVRFRHPLMRSAIYQAANPRERAATHRALAKVLTANPDRRVWHLAASVIGPDEDVALELEEAAARAQRRGAIAVAIEALERAAAFGDRPDQKARRLLESAAMAFDVGRLDHARRLLNEAESLEIGTQERTRALLVKEMFDDGIPAEVERVKRLVDLADDAAETDVDLALGLLRSAALQSWWSDADDDSRLAVVTAADRMPVGRDDPRTMAIRAVADPIRQGGAVLERLARFNPEETNDPALVRLYGQAATTVGDIASAARFMEAASTGLRRQGRLGLLAPALTFVAWAHIRLGNFNLAAPAADEGLRLSHETHQPLWAASSLGAQAMLAALRGDSDAADRIARELEAAALPMGLGSLMSVVPLTRGVAAIGSGRYDDAYGYLARLFERGDPAYHYQERWRAVGYLAEAGAHADRRKDARRIVAGLESFAAMTPSPGVQIPMNYARTVLADDDSAEDLFNTALAADLTFWPFERARLLMAYGEWLRRQRRLSESRAPLRVARDTFDALGAGPWAERARHELNAAGETSRKRLPGAWDNLSPQELQIAQMAAQGLSNREIGQQLYLSHRTVGSHLYRIFPKLGVTSRAQLHQALSATPA